MTDAADDKKPDALRIVQGRSPAYPFISLDKAIERADQIRAAGAARTALVPETFYNVWKVGANSSSARQTMAALNHFGLVDYLGRGENRQCKLSELALRIVLDKQPSSVERAKAIKEAALMPPIHAELFEKFGPLGAADVVVVTYLTRDRGYNESAAQILVDEYKATLEFAGLTKPDNMPELDADSATVTPPPVVEIGDLVRVEMDGVIQMERARVRHVMEDQGIKWFFVEGSDTGLRMEQIALVQKGSDQKPLVPPTLPEARQQLVMPEPSGDWREERLLDEGGEEILIRYKGEPSVSRYEFIRDYLDFKLQRLTKSAKRDAGE